MSENNTSVTSNNSYAQALFELASENYVLLEVEEQTTAILKLIKDSSEFRDLIKNPTTKNSELTKVMETIADQNNFNGLLKRFISFLIQAAKELNEKDIAKVKEELAEHFGSNIKLNYKHDPSLIGGLVLKVGSTMVDTSIKNKLQQIEKKMIEA